MPIRQFQKRGLARAVKNGADETKFAALFKISPAGQLLENSAGYFLLNPTTFEETKGANWVQSSIAGQSDPVLQWVSSGAKTITFDALVTLDKAGMGPESQLLKSDVNVPARFPAEIAAKLYAAQINAVLGQEKLSTDLDITMKLNYYRSLLYPVYTKNKGRKKLESSPPILVLLSGRTITTNDYDLGMTNKSTMWVLTELKIKTTKMLPNLAPMEAVVSFTLVQYAPESFSSDDFIIQE